jgi:serine/threonine protein kinase
MGRPPRPVARRRRLKESSLRACGAGRAPPHDRARTSGDNLCRAESHEHGNHCQPRIRRVPSRCPALAAAHAARGERCGQLVSKEPDWPALPSSTSNSVRSLLRRCLDKDPTRRLRDIGEARLALDGAFSTAAAPATALATSSSRGRLEWTALAVAVVGTVAMVVPTVRHLRETPPLAAPEARVDIVTPATDRPTDCALSPDGRQIRI